MKDLLAVLKIAVPEKIFIKDPETSDLGKRIIESSIILINEIGFEQLANLWLQLKLILVILLTAYHFYLGLLLNQFKLDQNKKSSKFYRYINEIPTLLLILIVFIVIFKPI